MNLLRIAPAFACRDFALFCITYRFFEQERFFILQRYCFLNPQARHLLLLTYSAPQDFTILKCYLVSLTFYNCIRIDFLQKKI